MITTKLIYKFGVSCVLCLGATVAMNAQKQSAVASGTKRIIVSQTTSGATTTAWTTVLKTTYDSSNVSSGTLVVGMSAITSLVSDDIRVGPLAILLDNTGIQARILLDCTAPCQGSSNNVPASNLATPGVITLDQAYHFLNVLDATTFSDVTDKIAGAHSFNFYKTGLDQTVHTIEFQIRFMVDTSALPAGLTLSSVMAGVGSRTMIVTPVRMGSSEEQE